MAYNRWIYSDELYHHGVRDQKWGVKNGPPYPLDRSISDGHKLIKPDGSPQGKKKYKTVFVSGSSKTQDEASGYYRKELPKDIQKQLDEHMRKGNRIIVGDAPGIDRQVQDYLNSKKYRNVEVYGPGKEVRYSANSKWKTNPIDDPDHEPGSKEWLAKKDIAMTEAADEGLAIVLDEGAKATRKNIQRLSDSGKSVKVFSLNQDGSDSWEDDWDREAYAKKGLAEATREEFNRRFAKDDPDKFFNSIMFGSKSKDHNAYIDYTEFLDRVEVTDKYTDLHKQSESLTKELNEAYYRSRDLEAQGVKPANNPYYKKYQDLRDKINRIDSEAINEACRILGVDPKKTKGFTAAYIDESLYDSHLRKNLEPDYQNKSNPKPQKKSISSRINSFMDRVFGNSIKAQEKGQKKIDVNFEPVTSEKAKTKRGETYEINDWNGDAQDTIKVFKSNPETHINIARKAALQEARRIIGWYAKDNPEAKRFLNMSDQQLSKRIGLDFASAYSHGTIEFSFGDAGTGDFLGHEVDVEYDLNRRKVMNVSVNG